MTLPGNNDNQGDKMRRPSWVSLQEYAQLKYEYGGSLDIRPAWVTPGEYASMIREYGGG